MHENARHPRIATRLAAATALAFVITASHSDASPFTWEGSRTFYCFIQSASGEDELIVPSFEPFTLTVAMGSSFAPRDSLGKCTIDLGSGLAWVQGDTIHVAHVSEYSRSSGASRDAEYGDRRWNVTLRATRLGDSEVLCSMTCPGRDGRIDEMDIVLPIAVEADRIRLGKVQVVREEMVRDGQRYRYGGRFLVPIDSAERLPHGDIKTEASVLYQEAAECSTFSGEPRKIGFVVFIRADGTMHSYRPYIWNKGVDPVPDPSMVAAGERALKRWKFLPARTRSHAVANYLHVDVPVRGVNTPH